MRYIAFLLCVGVLASCNNKKYLARHLDEEGRRWVYEEHLVVDAGLDIARQEYPIRGKSDLEYGLETLIRQRPNRKLLGMRLRLGLYNRYKSAKDTQKMKAWIRRSFGEPPVLYDTKKTLATVESMRFYLNRQGYYDAKVTCDTVFKKHRAYVTYHVEVGKPLLMNAPEYHAEDSVIQGVLDELEEGSLLNTNAPLSESAFANEVNRLVIALRNRGYQKFERNYIQFEADSVNADADTIKQSIWAGKAQVAPKANIYVQLRNPSDSTRHEAYHIRRIFIIPDEQLRRPNELEEPTYDTTWISTNYAILRRPETELYVRDSVLMNALGFHSGDLYSFEESRTTIANLSDLGVFKFPRLDFAPAPADSTGARLDAVLRMRTAQKMVLGADVEANTDNANLGGAVNLNFRNRNLFRGAETFLFNVETGADFILTPQSDSTGTENAEGFSRFINMVDVNAEMSIYFPKYLGPAPLKRLFKMQKPRSRISLGGRYLQQSNDFRVTSFYGQYGYEWNRGKQHRFTYNPFDVNITLEPQLNPEYRDNLAAQNPTLLATLRDRFVITSTNYSYQYISANNERRLWSSRLNLEWAGFVLDMLDRAVKPNENFKIFNIDYSRYVKAEIDLRYNHILGRKQSLVARFTTGVAIPYGKTKNIPFSKRFFLGGPNSMRAWQMRQLGPGRVQAVQNAAFQLGDFRLETNLEYRLKLGGYLELGFFVDAGNIWLLNPREELDPDTGEVLENGRLEGDFLQELAVCGGLGLRLDFSFFVLRLDWAAQLRSPFPYSVDSEGQGRYWNFYPFRIENRSNLVLGIGYPF